MKNTHLQFLAALLLGFIGFSCRKDTNVLPTTIVGKWLLVSTFNGYLNGGNFAWNPQQAGRTEILDLTSAGAYLLTETDSSSIGVQSRICNGTYSLNFADSSFAHTTNCNTRTLVLKMTLLTQDTVIFDHQVREGVIREKYARMEN